MTTKVPTELIADDAVTTAKVLDANCANLRLAIG